MDDRDLMRSLIAEGYRLGAMLPSLAGKPLDDALRALDFLADFLDAVRTGDEAAKRMLLVEGELTARLLRTRIDATESGQSPQPVEQVSWADRMRQAVEAEDHAEIAELLEQGEARRWLDRGRVH